MSYSIKGKAGKGYHNRLNEFYDNLLTKYADELNNNDCSYFTNNGVDLKRFNAFFIELIKQTDAFLKKKQCTVKFFN